MERTLTGSMRSIVTCGVKLTDRTLAGDEFQFPTHFRRVVILISEPFNDPLIE